MPEAVSAALERLREWSQDDLHVVRSVRMHEPVYANPAALRADVRALLDALTDTAHELADVNFSRELQFKAANLNRDRADELQQRLEEITGIVTDMVMAGPATADWRFYTDQLFRAARGDAKPPVAPPGRAGGQ